MKLARRWTQDVPGSEPEHKLFSLLLHVLNVTENKLSPPCRFTVTHLEMWSTTWWNQLTELWFRSSSRSSMRKTSVRTTICAVQWLMCNPVILYTSCCIYIRIYICIYTVYIISIPFISLYFLLFILQLIITFTLALQHSTFTYFLDL